MFSTEKVEEYYDKCQKYYNWFWSDKESLGMHYGFWYPETKSKKEALINEHREVAELLHLLPQNRVLDAGCGIGGAAIWMAEKFDCSVTGITLSAVQVKLANKYAHKRDVDGKTEFLKMDYFNTDFPDAFFDKIYAIESFCHAYPFPEKLFKEFNRILKPDGKVVISDAFLLRKPETKQELDYVNKFYLGWKLNGGNTLSELEKAAELCGFKMTNFENKLPYIKKNVLNVYLRGVLAYPIIRFLRACRIIALTELENLYAAIGQRGMVKKNIMGYGIMVFEKNNSNI